MTADWAMVWITLVYVIATCAICYFNYQSAKASREQLAESQEQYKESKRLECLPFLQMELPTESIRPLFEIEASLCKQRKKDTIYRIVRLKNIGNGTATNITYCWNCREKGISEADFPPINAIMHGDSYYLQLACNADEDAESGIKAVLVFEFNDLLGNNYSQSINLYFEELDLIRCENDTPHLFGE